MRCHRRPSGESHLCHLPSLPEHLPTPAKSQAKKRASSQIRLSLSFFMPAHSARCDGEMLCHCTQSATLRGARALPRLPANFFSVRGGPIAMKGFFYHTNQIRVCFLADCGGNEGICQGRVIGPGTDHQEKKKESIS